MKKFKSVLKQRLALMIGFNGLAIVFMGLTGIYGNITAGGSENLADMISGFQVGIFIGIQIMMLITIAKYGQALKNENKLEKLYIKEHDERRKLIQDKIGGVGFNFAIAVIGTATVMAGFFHQLVFLTLLGVLILMVHVKGFLKIYYRNKF